MEDFNSVFLQVSRSLKSLQDLTITKIKQIENKEYGFDIVEDLDLIEYSNFFDTTITYLKSKIPSHETFFELRSNVSQLYDFDIKATIEKRTISFLGFFYNYIQYGLGSQRKFITSFLETLKQLNYKVENILYWMSIQG